MLARMTLAILVLIVGCDQRHRDIARADSVAPANPQPTSTDGEGGGYIPDIAEYKRLGRDGGKDHFVLFGVRDAAAPNMLLNRWLYQNLPDPTRTLTAYRSQGVAPA